MTNKTTTLGWAEGGWLGYWGIRNAEEDIHITIKLLLPLFHSFLYARARARTKAAKHHV